MSYLNNCFLQYNKQFQPIKTGNRSWWFVSCCVAIISDKGKWSLNLPNCGLICISHLGKVVTHDQNVSSGAGCASSPAANSCPIIRPHLPESSPSKAIRPILTGSNGRWRIVSIWSAARHRRSFGGRKKPSPRLDSRSISLCGLLYLYPFVNFLQVFRFLLYML